MAIRDDLQGENIMQVHIRCYEDDSFGGHEHPIVFEVDPPDVPEKKIQDLSGEPRIFKKMSSLKWSVPPGVAVIFVEHGFLHSPGNTFACTGSGQDDHLHNHRPSLGDIFQGWYWTKIA